MRNAELLSTTTAPAFTARGACSFEIGLPAENSARSMPSRELSPSTSTVWVSPQNDTLLPAVRVDASRRSSW